MEEEKSYQEIRKELIQKYKTEIIPKLTVFEKDRKAKSNSSKEFGKKLLKLLVTIIIGYYIIVILLSIVLFIIALLNQMNFIQNILGFVFVMFSLPINILPVVAIICLFVWLFQYGIKAGSFQNKIKDIVMPVFCSCFPDLKWVPNREHLTDIYKSVNILPRFDFLKYDDCFEGSYKGVNFVIEEVDAKVKSKNGSSSVFRGLIIRFTNFNKKFKGHTVIQPTFFSLASERAKNLHKTEMDDITFEKAYNVYTSDDVEARYLITPSFMDRINNIKNVFKSDCVFVSFICGQFFLGLKSYENFFDYGQFYNSLDDPKPFIKMSEEVISILKLIDHFKLDQNIGM